MRISLLPRFNLHISLHRRKHEIGEGEDPEANKRRTKEKIGSEIGFNHKWGSQKGGETGRREQERGNSAEDNEAHLNMFYGVIDGR
jgi:hypothetical protein